MSDNIPFEMQMEIMKRLPVKSLIQFRSVSKSWRSLIDNPKFIADYHPHRHNHRLLVRYVDSHEDFHKYVILVDDDSFPQHKIPITLPLYVSTTTSQDLVDRYVTTSTSQGLVCFFIYDKNHKDTLTRAVLWNPAIRKSVDIVVPNVLSNNRCTTTLIAFGVSPHTNDSMLVQITYDIRGEYDTISCIPWHVEVFTLSTGVWRSLCNNLPRKYSLRDYAAIDRFIYWIGVDSCDVDGGGRKRNMIMSFDMTSEVFEEISLPDCLARLVFYHLDIFNLRESLVVFESDEHTHKQYVVRIMEHGVPNSFRKLYTINAPDASITTVFQFRKSGEAIIQRSFNFGGRYATSVYDPCSEQFKDILISEKACLVSVSSYRETLLLLDH